MESKIYITSDLHLCHDKSFMYAPRGFSSIQEHDSAIINNWNNIVTKNDIIYILGDIFLNDKNKSLENLCQLNGIKYFIAGNHDTPEKIKWIAAYPELNITCLGYSNVLQHKHWKFYLSHYPTIASRFDYDKPIKKLVINLCGHSHTKDKFEDWERYQSPIYHCELDAHECLPIALDDIINDCKNKFNKEYNYV